MPTSTFSIILVIMASVIGATGGYFFKIASGKITLSISSLIKNFKLYLGFFFFGIAALLGIIALRYGELNVLYPISSLSYVWSLFFGKKFFNEKINLYKQAGVALIILGVIVIVQ